jgi:1,4-dihydroxy-6-naphthoate synthase
MDIISIAYSPCPNDTFAFHAMVNGLVDTEGLRFEPHLMDIEELNRSAAAGTYDICKMSYHAYFFFLDKYLMLRCGSALGYGNGPVFVKRKGDRGVPPYSVVAIPGKMTTAALLLQIAHPDIPICKEVVFSNIAHEIVEGRVDAGVLIHEGRFVFHEMDLELIEDLGESWFKFSRCPIPLGGIAIRRGSDLVEKVERILRRSILFARDNPDLSSDYISQNAQELSKTVQKKHIDLFVNDNTLNISKEGEEAVGKLYSYFLKLNPSFKKENNLFKM